MPLPALLALAAALEGVWVASALAGDLGQGGIPGLALRQFAAALLFLLALLGVARGPTPADPRRAVLLVLLAGLAFRLTLLGTTPSLSGDAWRYLWEGRVQAAGWNPYLVPPLDPALAPLRDGVWLRVNHPQVPAIYGPLLEALFALCARLPGELLPFKLAFLAADLTIQLGLLRALLRRGQNPLWVLLWAWHPLPILEVAGQAHLEVVPIALLVWALDQHERERPRAAALLLGAAIAAKYLPVLILPAFLAAAPGWGQRLRRAGWTALPGAALATPWLLSGAGPGSALLTYGATWRSNDGGFWLLERLLSWSGASAALCRALLPRLLDVPPGTDPGQHETWLLLPAKAVVALAVVAGTAWLARPGPDGRVDLQRAAGGAAGLFLLGSPTVHPWYVLWVLPFLPATPGRAAWLHLSLTAPLAYVSLLGYTGDPETWREPLAVRAAEYGPLAVLLLGSRLAAWRSPPPPPPGGPRP